MDALANADTVVKHWVDDSDIDPLTCLAAVISNPLIKINGGFAQLVGTSLDVPKLWLPKLHLATVAMTLAVRCRPVASGVALLMASRASTPVGVDVWASMRHLCTMPAAVSAALASRRTDIQLFVATAWQGIALAAGPDCWKWVTTALDGAWLVMPGTQFADDIRVAMATMEIELVPRRNGHLAMWGEDGVDILIGDKCLLLLYLIFGQLQYAHSIPMFVAAQIKTAASAPWVKTAMLCQAGT